MNYVIVIVQKFFYKIRMASCVTINSLKPNILKLLNNAILTIQYTLNQNCRKCYAAKPTSPEKGHILIKRWNSRMNDIYTKPFF